MYFTIIFIYLHPFSFLFFTENLGQSLQNLHQHVSGSSRTNSRNFHVIQGLFRNFWASFLKVTAGLSFPMSWPENLKLQSCFSRTFNLQSRRFHHCCSSRSKARRTTLHASFSSDEVIVVVFIFSGDLFLENFQSLFSRFLNF